MCTDVYKSLWPLLVLCMLVKFSANDIWEYFSYFPRNKTLTFHANCLQRRQFFVGNVKAYFLRKIKILSICCLLNLPIQ